MGYIREGMLIVLPLDRKVLTASKCAENDATINGVSPRFLSLAVRSASLLINNWMVSLSPRFAAACNAVQPSERAMALTSARWRELAPWNSNIAVATLACPCKQA